MTPSAGRPAAGDARGGRHHHHHRHRRSTAVPLLLLLAVAAVSAAHSAAAPTVSHVQHAWAHGTGLDTTPPIAVGDREITVSVEIPSYYDAADQRRVLITATDRDTKEQVSNVTYLMGLFHDGRMIFRNYFFAADGLLTMDVVTAANDAVVINGVQDPLLGAWSAASPERPLTVSGPIFESGGLYTFEIELRTVDSPDNVVEGLGTYEADVTIVENAEFVQADSAGGEVRFGTRSYFDSISNFEYSPADGTVTFDMPFDWDAASISHIPVVHVEVRFPKGFAEFLAPSYSGAVNGIDLFRSSISVDDYTADDERIVHFVLLREHLEHILAQLRNQQQQQQQQQQQLPQHADGMMAFKLQAGTETDFPVSAWTRDESLRVDLSWDPPEIAPDQRTRFVYTIRDAATAEPLRNSGFDLVILQNGRELHRESGNAQVGGGFADYMFGSDQTGPTVIRFENIRGTGLATEFGVVVIPEFGAAALLVMAAAIAVAAALAATSQKRLFTLSPA